MSERVSSSNEVTYTLDLAGGRRGGKGSTRGESQRAATIPRIARLMALALRFERLVWEQQIQHYAELARLGRVTRGRMTQIMQLLHLAPDIQEQILFLPEIPGVNERNLRAIVRHIDWSEQRRMFERFTQPGGTPLA